MKKINMWGSFSMVAMLALAVVVQVPVQAQTWRMVSGSPVVVENTACNSAKDTTGVNAGRTVLLMCQANLWKPVSTGSTGTGGTGGGSSCPPPAPFVFPAKYVLPNILVTSDTITLSGTTCPAALSVSGGIDMQCSVNSGPFGACGGYLAPGNTLAVRLNSGADNSEARMTITIAGVSTDFWTWAHQNHWSEWYSTLTCILPDDWSSTVAGQGTYMTPGTTCTVSGARGAYYATYSASNTDYCATTYPGLSAIPANFYYQQCQ